MPAHSLAARPGAVPPESAEPAGTAFLDTTGFRQDLPPTQCRNSAPLVGRTLTRRRPAMARDSREKIAGRTFDEWARPAWSSLRRAHFPYSDRSMIQEPRSHPRAAHSVDVR